MLRYFLPHDASGAPAGEELPHAHDAALVRALDAFVLGGPRAPRRVLVARDLGGELFLADEGDPEGLPESIAHTMAQHDLTRGRAPRFLDVADVWLMCVELIEQAADSPGANDPVQLYGRLTGPFGDSGASRAWNGQLTVTRGDLLRGFVEGTQQAFVADGATVLHAAVPGDRQAELAQGHGLVLCYPLLPADAGGLDSGNEACAVQVFSALVQAMHDDLNKHHARIPFAKRVLPVANRKQLEAQLEAEGWVVRDDVAEKRSGLLSRQRTALPPEWSLADIGPIGREALGALLPAFPDARSSTLWGRIHKDAPPVAVTPPRPRPMPVEQPFRRSAPDWMNDFGPAPGAPAPRRTRVAPLGAIPTPAPALPPRAAPAPAARPTKPKPDWMKDFE